MTRKKKQLYNQKIIEERLKMWKKGKLFVVPLLLLLGIFLAACSGSDNNDSSSNNQTDSGDSESSGEIGGELVIFNWTEYMPQEVLDMFEEEFGVDIVYTTFASNQEMLAKVKSGTVAYDIVVPSDFYVQVMIEEGLLQKINFDNIPNFENIADEWKNLEYDPNNEYSVVYMYGYDGIIYNKDKVKETPTSWGDLWNPEYKGHVVLMDAADELMNMAHQYLGYDMNDPTEDEINEAGEKLKELMPNVMMFTEAPEAQLVNGEAWIVYGYSGEAGVAYKENPAIDFVLPEEGGIKWTDNMVIPANAKNKEAAEAFINFILRPEISKMLSEDYPYGNPNVKALELLGEEHTNLPGLNVPPEAVEKAQWAKVLDPQRTQLVNRVVQEAKIQAGN